MVKQSWVDSWDSEIVASEIFQEKVSVSMIILSKIYKIYNY